MQLELWGQLQAARRRISTLESRIDLLEHLVERTGQIVAELAAWHDRENIPVADEFVPTLSQQHPLTINGQRYYEMDLATHNLPEDAPETRESVGAWGAR